MDVEKTIEFLLGEAAKHDQQIAQLAELILRLGESQEALVESQIETQKRFRETDERFRQIREELRELGKETDRRIQALTSAVGALIRKMDEGK